MPRMLRVSGQMMSLSQHCVSEVESSGVRGISEGKEKYKNMFFIVQEFAEKGEE